jgi:hypothetical protein
MPLLGKFAVAEVKKLCLLNQLVGVVTLTNFNHHLLLLHG